MGTLQRILDKKKEEIKQAKIDFPTAEMVSRLADLPASRDFKSAISQPKQVNLIAEIKKASPSKGVIRPDFNPVEISRIYQASGVQAISVLTDQEFFQGRLEYLNQVKAVTRLPILRKDFIIDEYQLYQSRFYGADAVLLIARLLSSEKLAEFLAIAAGLGLGALVEIHSAEELEKVKGGDCRIVGINNRDLDSFVVDLRTTGEIIGILPADKIIVSESGIGSHQDILDLEALGVNAVLIGGIFMESKDIAAKVKEIMGY